MTKFIIIGILCAIVEFYYGLWCIYHNSKGLAGVGGRTHIVMSFVLIAVCLYLDFKLHPTA